MSESIHVAFVGNPNCGKTTLFNAITGSKLKVANWPGVTVEKKEGQTSYEGMELTCIDTPGIYSLTSYTIEEKVTKKCVMDDDIEVIVNIVDASSLERNLFLTLQLLELGKPVVIAFNMMDIVAQQGIEIDLHRLPEMLGDIPVIPVSAAKKTGIETLLHAIVHHYEEGTKEYAVKYSEELEEKIKKLEVIMSARYPKHSSIRWHAIKLLECDEEVESDHPEAVTSIVDKSYEKEIIATKYQFIEDLVKETVYHKDKKEELTDKIDHLMVHPVFGIPIFLVIIAMVFGLTFTVGDLLKGVFEVGLSSFSDMVLNALSSIHTADWLQSLIVDGIISGVGGILTFIPNIVILFIALAILEDSGYMSRVAYIMDSIMGKAGLSGRAFLPMILGFGCTVPAIMATRALETVEDRRKTMIVTPFMSCSARMPIYVLFSGMFFGKYAALVSFSMYVIGLIIAVLTAIIYNKIQKGNDNNSLLIELPEYKKPNLRNIRIYVWTKLKDYLSKAGTVIFIASIIMWFLLNVGPAGMIASSEDSFGAYIGKFLVPVLAPCGLGMWQIGVALLSGISAKEVVVTSFAVLFGVSNANSTSGMSEIVEKLHQVNPAFGPLNAYCLMVFCLLYVPCVASIATIKKESESVSFTLKLLLFEILIAFVVSMLIFQIGSLFLQA